MNERDVLIKIGKRIKSIRAKQNMTQHDLSKKCQIEKASMSKIEAGLSNPTVRTLVKISSALDVAIEELFKE
jgi:transcriptional regulator with XRE-family HTH domain